MLFFISCLSYWPTVEWKKAVKALHFYTGFYSKVQSLSFLPHSEEEPSFRMPFPDCPGSDRQRTGIESTKEGMCHFSVFYSLSLLLWSS